VLIKSSTPKEEMVNLTNIALRNCYNLCRKTTTKELEKWKMKGKHFNRNNSMLKEQKTLIMLNQVADAAADFSEVFFFIFKTFSKFVNFNFL